MDQFYYFRAVQIHLKIGGHYFDAANGEALDSEGNQSADEETALIDSIAEVEEIENPLEGFGIVAVGMRLEGGVTEQIGQGAGAVEIVEAKWNREWRRLRQTSAPISAVEISGAARQGERLLVCGDGLIDHRMPHGGIGWIIWKHEVRCGGRKGGVGHRGDGGLVIESGVLIVRDRGEIQIGEMNRLVSRGEFIEFRLQTRMSYVRPDEPGNCQGNREDQGELGAFRHRWSIPRQGCPWDDKRR